MPNIRLKRGFAQQGRRKLIAGIGVNDFNGPVCGHRLDGSVWELDSYKVWRAMLLRCYNQKELDKHPTYAGCSVVPEWHSFTNFYAWYNLQGDWTGCDLDKDLLVPGNRIYGPDTCLKVPRYVNVVVHDNHSQRGQFPCGVTRAPSGSYVARMRITINGETKKLNIGCTFKTPEEASEAYIAAKKQYLQQIAIKLGGKAGLALLAFADRLTCTQPSHPSVLKEQPSSGCH